MSAVGSRRRAFTLVEIMIVVAIIGLLASLAIPSFLSARERARQNRANSDLRVLSEAVDMLHLDTGLWPGGINAGIARSGNDNETWDLSAPEAGLLANDGRFPNWQGPYVKRIESDPWGSNYFFDQDYDVNGTNVAVVGSFGKNGVGPNSYDADDIYVRVDQY
jgi:general secretion pathway protein G